MPRQLVTVIGLIVSLGVIALGLSLVAMPLYFQSLGVDAQTATVASTNALYQAQVDELREQEDDLEAINARVSQLRSQIPASGQLDDIFEVVARAAAASGVNLTAVTAGEQAPFDAGAVEGTSTATEPPAEETGASGAAPDASSAPDAAQAEGAPTAAPPTSRQQVDFTIEATAVGLAEATAFLDALRSGPRLLNSITASATAAGDGTMQVLVSALTYIDSEG